MREQTQEMLGALAGLQFFPAQEAELDEAAECDAAAFERLVRYAETAQSPGGALVSGSRNIITTARALETVRGMMEGKRGAKRVKAVLNYAQTALTLVPEQEREDVLKSEFPWISHELTIEALALSVRNTRS